MTDKPIAEERGDRTFKPIFNLNRHGTSSASQNLASRDLSRHGTSKTPSRISRPAVPNVTSRDFEVSISKMDPNGRTTTDLRFFADSPGDEYEEPPEAPVDLSQFSFPSQMLSNRRFVSQGSAEPSALSAKGEEPRGGAPEEPSIELCPPRRWARGRIVWEDLDMRRAHFGPRTEEPASIETDLRGFGAPPPATGAPAGRSPAGPLLLQTFRRFEEAVGSLGDDSPGTVRRIDELLEELRSLQNDTFDRFMSSIVSGETTWSGSAADIDSFNDWFESNDADLRRKRVTAARNDEQRDRDRLENMVASIRGRHSIRDDQMSDSELDGLVREAVLSMERLGEELRPHLGRIEAEEEEEEEGRV